MISDYKILGISENASIDEIKKAYRLKVKELHPDISEESKLIPNHYLFIEVCKAYERLIKGCTKHVINNAEITVNYNPHKVLVSHKDPSYVYYKTACKFYELIHPSHWNIDQTITINGKTTEERALQDKTMTKVKELVSLFPKAYYYFSIVVHEYPKSVWVVDSKEKMDLIEKRIKTYKKIIDSFLTWNIAR